MNKEIMKQIEDCGLFSKVNDEDEGHFSWRGCDHPECSEKGKGATVYEIKGYVSLRDAQEDNDNYYEFQVCGECFVAMYYGRE